MHAIFQVAGMQFKAAEGETLEVPLLGGTANSPVEISEVLLVNDGQTAHVGTPYVTGAKVMATVIDHTFGPKIRGYKYRRRTKYRKAVGHRQDITSLRVDKIIAPGK